MSVLASVTDYEYEMEKSAVLARSSRLALAETVRVWEASCYGSENVARHKNGKMEVHLDA